ncbi:hypothetical protein V2J09_009465 [Rumex salicifolius]
MPLPTSPPLFPSRPTLPAIPPLHAPASSSPEPASSSSEPTSLSPVPASSSHHSSSQPDSTSSSGMSLLYVLRFPMLSMESDTYRDSLVSAKRILRYLKGTIDSGLVLRPYVDNRLVAYFDVGWASDGDDCLSQHGFAVYYGGNLISWSSKMQHVVA